MALLGFGQNVPLKYNAFQHPLSNLIPFEVAHKLAFINGLYVYVEPFTHYSGPATAATSGGWVLTEIAAGSGNAQAVRLQDNAQGVLELVTDNGDNDAEILQKLGEQYKYVVGKHSGFLTRFSSDDVNDGEIHIGLNILDASPIASIPTDGLFFHKAETAVRMSFSAIKNNANQETVVVDQADMVDGEYRIYGFHVLPSGSIQVLWGTNWHNIQVVGSIAAGDLGIPDDEALAFHAAIQTGAVDVTTLRINGYAFWMEL